MMYNLISAMMLSAFASAKNALGAAKSVKIKLTNKKSPCLTFQFDLVSNDVAKNLIALILFLSSQQ